MALRIACALTGVLACGVSGCAAKKPALTAEQLKENEVHYLDGMIEEEQAIQERLLARCSREYRATSAAGHPEAPTIDVLVLSGGGAKGAFGAGFLIGWGEVTEPGLTRPEFDVVTGVSTGSLIAPMAFLGTDASYQLAATTYRNPHADWVQSRGLLDVLLTEQSFYTDEGLFRTIQETIGPAIPAIAAGAREDRSLLIAAVNLNQGLTKVWDLTQLATEVESGTLTTEEFCRRSLSSASIPVVFPPQVIDNNLYVDGSTTSDILLSVQALTPSASLPRRWQELHPHAPLPRVRIWVIANTPLFVEPVPVDTRDVAVLGRSLELAVQAGLIGQLRILALETAILRQSGFDAEFRFVAMPPGWRAKGRGMFNKSEMDAMANLGLAMGRDPTSWSTVVPNLLAPVELRDSLQASERTSASPAAPGGSP